MKKLFMVTLIFGCIFILLIVFLFESNQRFRNMTYNSIISTHQIPEAYVPIYQEAADEYEIPWELLASVHRVETIFSTMDPLVSPVGALGPFQFMPRTWIGWSYPGDELGDIEEDVDLTDVALIETHQGYGVDATGNGIADPFDLHDSTFAAARYLAEHGATDGDYEDALFAYNRSDEYVEEVLSYYRAYLDHYELIEIPPASGEQE